MLWGLHWEQRVEYECARQRDLRVLRLGGWRKAVHEGEEGRREAQCRDRPLEGEFLLWVESCLYLPTPTPTRSSYIEALTSRTSGGCDFIWK